MSLPISSLTGFIVLIVFPPLNPPGQMKWHFHSAEPKVHLQKMSKGFNLVLKDGFPIDGPPGTVPGMITLSPSSLT